MRCPRCGRPSPVFLGRPDAIRCPGCAYAGAPPAECVEPLQQAARLLAGMDQRQRQLTGAQRRTLLLGRRKATTFVMLALLLGLPMFACAGCGVLLGLFSEGTSFTDVLVMATPLVAFVAPVLFFWSLLARARHKIERLCVAVPPAAPGEPAACHVCGGPLAARGNEPLARCGFCGADNLVEPAALARASHRQDFALDSLETEIEREGRSAAKAAGTASALLVPASIVVPLAALVVAFAILMSIQRPAYQGVEYADVAPAGSACVAVVRRPAGGVARLDFDGNPPKGQPNDLGEAPPETPTYRAAALVGRTMKSKYSGKPGRVVRVYSSQLNPRTNTVEIVSETGERSTHFAAGTCAP